MSNAILHSSQYQNYRRIDLIVIHCSATRATQRYTVDDCRRDHRDRGFADIGYHYYITRDGVVHAGRALYTVGAHATGYNAHSIGICYEGGLDIRGRPADTRTVEQKETLHKLIERLKEDYPGVLLPLLRDNLPSSVLSTCVKFLSARVFGYHKAVHGYRGLLRNRYQIGRASCRERVYSYV